MFQLGSLHSGTEGLARVCTKILFARMLLLLRCGTLIHICCALNVKCPSQAHVSEHSVLSWGAVWGGSEVF